MISCRRSIVYTVYNVGIKHFHIRTKTSVNIDGGLFPVLHIIYYYKMMIMDNCIILTINDKVSKALY